jgi:hypothetical protein
MLKHYSSDASGGSGEAPSTDSDAAGPDLTAYRAWTDVVSPPDLPDSSINADPALVGDTFIFESSWTDTGLEIAASDGGLWLVEQSSSSAGEFASRATTADGSASFELADSHDIPIWGLASDDFSFI